MKHESRRGSYDRKGPCRRRRRPDRSACRRLVGPIGEGKGRKVKSELKQRPQETPVARVITDH
uniref:Uncharacterized protein n=1 Tax=Oryza punctata TaxID=4537 RepID=A0A0E0KTK1_ORYPU